MLWLTECYHRYHRCMVRFIHHMLHGWLCVPASEKKEMNTQSLSQSTGEKKRKFSIKWFYRVTNAGAQSAMETQMRGQPMAWEGRVCKGFHGSGLYWKPHHRDLMQNTEVLDNEEEARICGFSKTTAMNSNYQYVTEWCEMFMEIETVGREQTEWHRRRERDSGMGEK